MSVAIANGSITHTFGNVACVAMQYVKDYFAEDYFNVVHISTKMSYKQLDIYRTKNTDFWKLQKPMLIMRPRINLDDSSKYFYGSNWMNRTNNIKSGVEFANLIGLIEDKQNGVNLRFLWNRIRIEYDVVIIVDTMNEQLNSAHYLMNAITPNCPFMIRTSLESYVPKNIIFKLAEHMGIDCTDTSNILSYINTYGHTPFTYKLKNGSGNDEFFALYDTNIETTVSDISIDDGESKNMLMDTFTISFTMSCEFNAMALYYLFLRDKNDVLIRCPHIDTDTKGVIKTLYTIPLYHNVQVPPGWKIIASCPYFIEVEDTPDETLLTPIIPEYIRNVLRFQKSMGLVQDTLIKFIVFRGNTQLCPDEDYFVDTLDVDNIKLYTLSTKKHITYRVVILAHMELIHSIKSEMEEFNKEK